MRLSRIYSNRPEVFAPIDFNPGLNVILAEIRRPENREKTTHNLGKTTLGRLIDFCFLAKREPEFFLFKNKELFEPFVFFLEVALFDSTFVTIRRSVAEPTKIWLMLHAEGRKDFTLTSEARWSHVVAFEKARQLLDGILDLRSIRPWAFRNVLGYQLRTQEDYGHVFQLHKYRGGHSEWKPLLAHLLGFDSAVVQGQYEKEDELEKARAKAAEAALELSGAPSDMSKLEGLLLLKQDEVERKQALLAAFDFQQVDTEQTRALVADVNSSISRLNRERYALLQNRKKVSEAIEEHRVLFDPDAAAELFKEAGVLFAGQIKRDFQQLIEFSRDITDERRKYLKEEARELDGRLAALEKELTDLGARRTHLLRFLGSADVFEKYRALSEELVGARADAESLARQRDALLRVESLRAKAKLLAAEWDELRDAVEEEVTKRNRDKGGRFTAIRRRFSGIVEHVLSRRAVLSVDVNGDGHLEFDANIVDEQGRSTNADEGHTFRKLLCVAFDLAVMHAHREGNYPRFVFHDGVFESLDVRVKQNLVEVIREETASGTQHIITLIDTDMPPADREGTGPFAEGEIVVRLHDEDESGRLFRMPTW